MPNEDKRQRELTQEEIRAQDEKFRTFFSTSVAQVPQAMSRRQEEEVPQRSLLDKLFRRKPKTEEPAPLPSVPAEMPTGEIRLDRAADEPEAGLELGFPVPEKLLSFEEPEPAPAPQKQPEPTPPPVVPQPQTEPAPEAEPAAKPEPKPAAKPEPAAKPRKAEAAPRPAKPRAPVPRSPQEQQEDAEMQELKAMLFGTPEPPKPQKPAAPKPQPKAKPRPAAPAQEPVTGLVFAEEKPAQTPQKPAPAPKPAETPDIRLETPAEAPAFHFFGVGEDEPQAPAGAAAPSMDDSMSLPLLEKVEEADRQPAPAPAPEASAETQPAVQAEEMPETEPASPEQVGETLRRTGAALTLRCVLGGVLAAVLLHFGLTAEGLLAPLSVLDPAVAPSAFYAANLLFLAAELAVAFPVLRDGLCGLRGRPSADTMPALAGCAALVQAVVALLNAKSYQASNFTLLSGIAALGLFLALLGSRVMLAAVQGGYELAAHASECRGAYRVRDKEVIRSLARSLEQKDPWILLSRPAEWDTALVEQCFGERAGERRSRKTAYILLGVSLVSGLAFLLLGGGVNGGAAALTAMLCLGAPFSSTLVAGIASLRLQRTAAVSGAVVPGWAAIEELGGVDTVQVDIDDLFTPDSVTLEDIRIFKGGRIDRAILYSASVLGQSCDTLRGLFRQIIEDRTEILYPVKDLECHRGLGFSAWCDNNCILIGNRAYLQREGVLLPEKDYEDKHSQNGSRQILYLAVSGTLHAMFVLRYMGGRNVARGLEALQKENIRLLVRCDDPSMTARHITDAYHLPEGMVTLLDQEQCRTLETSAAAGAETGNCCMITLKGFASLSGGLRAAEQAQNAETSATTVQLASVWFSVVIGAVLTYAGSVGGLSVATVLMYQAAWSALSLAVCALKQHN